jgi:FMN phosphatase YigB (HAD superfamily)
MPRNTCGTLGVRDLFERVHGADLVNVWKAGPAYYRAILADAGVDAALAILVDDSDLAIAWAKECGMRGFVVRRDDDEPFDTAVPQAFDEVERALA